MKADASHNSSGNSTTVPFLDLTAPHVELESELVSCFRHALGTAEFIGGSTLEAFEQAFAKYCGTQYCIGVGSGTDALRLAILAARIPEGSVIITVPNTFIATTEAITQAGCWPEFIDVDEQTFNMDVARLDDYLSKECLKDGGSGRLISRRTGRPIAAVIPVHLRGQVADMDPILELAGRFGLQVIEDACQAHGAEYFSRTEGRWRRAGSMGHAAAFSFYPGKNLGACGEAGAVTTNDSAIARRVRMLRDHGQSRKYYHDAEGYNARLDSIQAAILACKLPHLPAWNAKRREAAERYRKLLSVAQPAVIVPCEPSWAESVYHLYVVRVPDRDSVRTHLTSAGIGTGIHYPIPLHLQSAYSRLGYKSGDFPVAEKLASDILSLPMFPTLRLEQQLRVSAEIINAVEIAASPAVDAREELAAS
jgi:dTDP-4-amino-4,6-dideoxygalactose transaminase